MPKTVGDREIDARIAVFFERALARPKQIGLRCCLSYALSALHCLRSSGTGSRVRSHSGTPVSWRAAAYAASSGEAQCPHRTSLNSTDHRCPIFDSRSKPALVGYSYDSSCMAASSDSDFRSDTSWGSKCRPLAGVADATSTVPRQSQTLSKRAPSRIDMNQRSIVATHRRMRVGRGSSRFACVKSSLDRCTEVC